MVPVIGFFGVPREKFSEAVLRTFEDQTMAGWGFEAIEKDCYRSTKFHSKIL
jgi:hypothetical protein